MATTNRQRINAILNYKQYDRIPIMHFGFWEETLQKWVKEGYLKPQGISNIIDGDMQQYKIGKKLGFDDNFMVYVGQKGDWYDFPLFPPFNPHVVEDLGNGSLIKIDVDGVFVLAKEGVTSIPHEFDHTLKDRKSWGESYLPKLQWNDERLDIDSLRQLVKENDVRSRHTGVYCGSLFGKLRNYFGLVEISYLQADDPDLLIECIDAIANISFETTKHVFESGIALDFAHFWEDICYRNGSLVNPSIFRKITGKHYRRIADLCNKHNINIISVDCDGFVEDLVPIWLDNGVNTMFPIEYGSWEYSFSSMRKKFGKDIRGVGNVDKTILSKDKTAIDLEIDRIRRLVDLGGYLPCLDHRIAPDAKWDLVLYYCDKMKETFWK